jgi:Uma2 family endonuclease
MATVGIRIGPADQGRRMTLEEFMEADAEEGYRYELARGVLEVTLVPNDPHGEIVCNLGRLIYRYWDLHPRLIRRIGGGGEFQVWIPELESGRNPDYAIVFAGTPKNSRGRRPPSWVAEVVSRGGEDRDYIEKREEYLQIGILEYWIIDPELGQVLVLSREEVDGVAARTERIFAGEETIQSRLLPDFQGTVTDLWANPEPDEDL